MGLERKEIWTGQDSVDLSGGGGQPRMSRRPIQRMHSFGIKVIYAESQKLSLSYEWGVKGTGQPAPVKQGLEEGGGGRIRDKRMRDYDRGME